MSGVLGFWLGAVVIGALSLPIGYRFFRRFPDGGAGLSLALGVVLTSYAYFILRVFSVLPFGPGGYVLAVGLLGIGSAWCIADARRRGTQFAPRLAVCIATLGLFSAMYFGMVTIRSENPNIEFTEQPMDFLYLNAALESPAYPPDDPWLSGERASYYYFGYIQVSLLTGISGVPSSTGYNLGLAYTFAATAIGGASVALALARWAMPRGARRWVTAVSPTVIVMLLVVGTMAAIFEWFAAHGHASQGLFELFGLEHRISCVLDERDGCYQVTNMPRTTHWYPDQFYMFFGVTRLIPNTIVEYPIFSFLLGDLHPHVTALPLVVLVTGIAAATWRGRGPVDWRTLRARPLESVILATLIAALAFQNAWDIITFSFVLVLAVLARNLAALPRIGAAKASLTYLLPLLVGAAALLVPWYLDFSSQAEGVKAYVEAGTSPAHAFGQWGALLVASLLALIPIRRSDWRAIGSAAPLTLWVPLVPFAVWAALVSYSSDLGAAMDARTGGTWWKLPLRMNTLPELKEAASLGLWTLFLYSLLIAFLSTAAVVFAGRRSFAAIPAALCATGALLLYGTELFYIKDVFDSRLNTVFKLSYQAWVLLSIGGAVSIVCAFGRGSVLARSAATVASIAVAIGAIYALIGIPNRTNGFGNEGAIDGLAGLAKFDPDEYGLAQWMKENTEPGSIIVEATGRTWRIGQNGQPEIAKSDTDYTDSGRISLRTGRPTLIGWYFHEVQWRGDVPAVRDELAARQTAADGIYLAGNNAATVLSTMERYGATYVVVGRIEQSRYPQQTLPPFEQFLDLAFESGGLRVYAVPTMKVVPTS